MTATRPGTVSGHVDELPPDEKAAGEKAAQGQAGGLSRSPAASTLTKPREAPEAFDPSAAQDDGSGADAAAAETAVGEPAGPGGPDGPGGPGRPGGSGGSGGSRGPGGAGRSGGGSVTRSRSAAVEVLARSWRQLTSMRTALILLFLLAVAAVPGSLLPQRDVSPLRVEEYFDEHPTLAPLLDRLGAFDVFSAPWFAAIYLLLFVSLIGCLSSRIRWHARALFTAPPKAPARPGRLPGGSTWTTSREAAEVVAAAAAVLRRRRFRVAAAAEGARRPDGRPDHSVAAEKGYLRETGNLVFHLALVALLAGVGLGSWYGYQGTVLVVQGNGFANTLVAYDQFRAGQLIDPARLTPFSVTLDRFEATYQPNGQPEEFRADVSYTTDLDSPVRTETVRVNHPLAIGDAKVYLIGYGYAPHFVLRDAEGEVVWESYVPCTPRDDMFTSTCTVKIPDTGLEPVGELREPQQFAFSAVLTPTTALNPMEGYVSVFPAARAPGLTITGYVGNLHLDEGIPQNVYTVDTRDMTQMQIDGPAGEDREAQVLAINNPEQRTVTGLPGGMELEVDGLRHFATFQVKSDPYKGWVLWASVVVIVGLVASLGVRRRRVWVRATPAAGGGSTVEVGGLTRSDADRFAAELESITEALRAATGSPGSSAGSSGGSSGTAAGSAARDQRESRDSSHSAAVGDRSPDSSSSKQEP